MRMDGKKRKGNRGEVMRREEKEERRMEVKR